MLTFRGNWSSILVTRVSSCSIPLFFHISIRNVYLDFTFFLHSKQRQSQVTGSSPLTTIIYYICGNTLSPSHNLLDKKKFFLPPAILNTPDFLQVHWLFKLSSQRLQRKLPQPPIHFFICLLWPFPSLSPWIPLLFSSCFSLQMTPIISLCLITFKLLLLQKLFPLYLPPSGTVLFSCFFFLPHCFSIYFQISSENISAPMPMPLNFSLPLLLCII